MAKSAAPKLPSRTGTEEPPRTAGGRVVRPDIQYFLVVPEDDPREASPLQGFSLGIMRVSELLRSIVDLPADVLEFALPEAALAGRRVNGVAAWQWTPVALYALGDLQVPPELPFWVMMTHNAEVARAVDAWIARQPYPPLHISEVPGPGRENARTVTPDELRDHFAVVLAKVAEVHPAIERSLVSEGIERWDGRPPEQYYPTPVPGHNVTLPNVMALQCLGMEFIDAGPAIAEDPADYRQWIATMADAVLVERSRTYRSPAFRTTPAQPDLYITAPSLYAHVYEGAFNFPKTKDGKAARTLLQMMRRQASYKLNGSGIAWVDIMKSQLAQGLMMMRRSETDIQVAAAGLRAAGTLSATVRLSGAANRVQGAVRQMAAHARSEKVKPAAKLVKTFAEVQARLAEAVGPELDAVIARSQTGVKLISNVPLEWLPVGDLPLMLANDVSRITATPGNLLIGQLARSRLRHVSPDMFKEVLVISAIESKDPIANILLDTLDQWRGAYRDKIGLRIVRVQNRREFVEAINAFDGGVMIFDGHGHHDQASGAATLRVGREDVSIWDMRNEIRVPPIVILSACDTQAADRSHATTANDFLNAGATTVVASLLPLYAPDAAMFIARLVWRLAEFLPAITGPQGRAVLWSEIVSGMFRLQLVYDLIMPLMMAGRLTLPQYSSLNMRAIELTTNQDDAWWSDTIGRLATMLGENEVAVKARAARVIATSDAIRYTQMGNPELIVIKTPELLAEVGYDMSGDDD